MDYKISPYILYYQKLCMDLAVSPHIKYLHKGFLWTIMYHHTSSTITYSCMDDTVSPHILYYQKLCMDLAVSPHIKYLHKGFLWTKMYHHTTSIITKSLYGPPSINTAGNTSYTSLCVLYVCSFSPNIKTA